ncbi:MAG: hypothetical protein JJ863_34370 [Deltaproteobacteria bacterium]|nr:hypothetical protein [Deltaproteobacteria bacterium]
MTGLGRFTRFGLVACVIACGGEGRDSDSSIRDMGVMDVGATDGGPQRDGFVPSEALTPEELLAASVVFGSCLNDEATVLKLVDVYFGDMRPHNWPSPYRLTDAELRCLANATDGCADVVACTGILVEESTGSCARSCTDGVWELCEESEHVRIDCERRGFSCDVERGCVPPDTTPCDRDTFAESCADGRPTRCIGEMVLQGALCTELGLECRVEEGALGDRAYCVGPEGSCEEGGEYGYYVETGTCVDADRHQMCANGGLFTRSCADFHPELSCQTMGGQGFCGFGSECDPFYLGGVSCDGSNVVVCELGRTTSVDCLSLGFTGCTSERGWSECSR